MSSASASADTAAIQKLAWKPEAVRYLTALLQALLVRTYGNNDDVPADAQPLDKTTAGAMVRAALASGLIVHYRGSHPELDIYGGIRRSTRPECHGHRNPLYCVVAPVAREWLERHGIYPPAPATQMELL